MSVPTREPKRIEDALALVEDAGRRHMGEGRISMGLTAKEPPPIGDIARFLLQTETLLKELTKANVPNKRQVRDCIWSVEDIDRINHDDGEFTLRFQFCAVSKPSFEAIAERISNLYGKLAYLAMAEPVEETP